MTTTHEKNPSLPDVNHITIDDESNKSPEPSHNMNGEYVALMETNGKECESWYYFIKYEGNEKSLKQLESQLNKVEWYVVDDLSVFDLDLDHFVSASTAKEMTKLELNAYSFHRKFDGKLREIDLGFKRKDKNEKKICKAFDQLGYGQIEDYIDDEDIDDEDLTDNESCTDSESDSQSSDSDSESNKKGLPPSLIPNHKNKNKTKHKPKNM
jgi:hypothetical protein